MSSTSAELRLQRNEDYQETWSFTDSDGVAIDLTGHTFAMKIKSAQGSPVTILSLDTEASSAVTGIKLLSPASAGQVMVTIFETDLDSGITSAGIGNVHGVTALASDMLMTNPDGVTKCVAKRPIRYEPGVT